MEPSQSWRKFWKRKNCTVREEFHWFARVMYYLGVFPCSFDTSKRDVNARARYQKCATILSVSFSIFSMLGMMSSLFLYLQQFKTVGDLRLTGTELFAIKTFLSALLISRGFVPMQCILRSNSIMNLVLSVAQFDTVFGIINKVKLIDRQFVIMGIAIIVNAVSDVGVAFPVMSQAFKEGAYVSLPGLLGIKQYWAQFLFSFIGRIYGEFGMTTMAYSFVFLGNVLRTRLNDLQLQLNETPNVETETDRPKISGSESESNILNTDKAEVNGLLISKEAAKISAEKLRNLHVLFNDFENAFATYILIYIGFAIVVLVMTFFCLVSFAASHSGENILNIALQKEFSAMSMSIVLLCLRLWAFVECGERLMTQGESLSSHIASIDTLALDQATSNQITMLRRQMKHLKFNFKVRGYFRLNRELVTTFLPTVVTFTVVLVQFRVVEQEMD